MKITIVAHGEQWSVESRTDHLTTDSVVDMAYRLIVATGHNSDRVKDSMWDLAKKGEG